jgi:large repetitive protein
VTNNGCSATDAVVVTVTPLPIADAGADVTATCANPNITLIATGGLSYNWTTPVVQNTPFTPLSNATYTVTVTDTNGCTATDEVVVTVIKTPPSLTLIPTFTTVNCINPSSVLNISGADSYTWTAPLTGVSPTVTPPSTTTYSVTGMDGNGCTATLSTTITVDNENPSITITPSPGNATLTCLVTTVNLTASGANSYSWTGGTLAVTTAGTYTVIGTGANFCTASSSISVGSDLTPPSAMITPSNLTLNCVTPTANLVASGGTSYTWDNSLGTNATVTPVSTPSGSTTYTVTVTGDNGCPATATAVVVVDKTTPTLSVTPNNAVINCSGSNNVDLTVSGATTYLWDHTLGTNATVNVAPLNTTLYCVTGTGANGCTATICQDVTVDAGAPQAEITATATTINCTVTSVDLTATGGGTYSWSSPGGSTATITVTPSVTTTYTVTVTGANSCTATKDIVITVNNTPPVAAINASTTNLGCVVTDAVLTASGGGTYLWSNTETSSVITVAPTATQIYVVTVTGANTCKTTATVTINVDNTLPTATITPATGTIDCTHPSVTFTTTGAATNTYNWDSPTVAGSAPTYVATPAQSTTYTVTVTGANSCTITQSVSVNVVNSLAVVVTTTTTSSNSTPDGSATFNITGWSSALQYSYGVGTLSTPLSISANPLVISALAAGTYTLKITDPSAPDCPKVIVFVIDNPSCTLDATFTKVDPKCKGGSDGSITLAVTGAIGTPITYNWDPTGNGNAPTGLAAGVYNVTITDGNSCTVVKTISLSDPLEVLISCAQVSPATSSLNDGVGVVTISNGTAPYNITVKNSGNTTVSTFTANSNAAINIPSGLAPGPHTVDVLDANGCAGQQCSFTIGAPGCNISLTMSIVTPINCNGNQGTIQATPSGANGIVSYSWSNAATTSTVGSLTGGTYTVTATDELNCPATGSITLIEPDALVISCQQLKQTDFGKSNGIGSVGISGGTLPYSITLNGSPKATATFNDLAEATYTVVVTDAKGCSQTCTFAITEVLPVCVMTVGMEITHEISCNGKSDGEILVGIFGGYSPYIIKWNPSQFDGVTLATNLSTGFYRVTVTDKYNCTASTSINIAQPAALTVALTQAQQILCFGDKTAAINTTVDNNQGNTIIYKWSPDINPAVQNPSGLGAGVYSVTATDENSCTGTKSIDIKQPTKLSLVCSQKKAVSVIGLSDGEGSVVITGGTPTYTVTGLPVGATVTTTPGVATIKGLKAGTFTVTVTDANGCKEDCQITITEPVPCTLTATVAIDKVVSCFGGSDGALKTTVTNATATPTFAWSPAGTPAVQNPTGLTAGTYTVTVTSGTCTTTATVNLTQPLAALTIACNEKTSASTSGTNDGVATVDIQGGTAPYTITGLPAGAVITPTPITTSGIITITGLGAGSYPITVKDANGCTQTCTVTITVTPPNCLMTISLAIDKEIACHGDKTGAIKTTVAGNNGSVTYTWSPNTTPAVQNPTGLGAGTYTVTATDVNITGCTKTATIIVGEPTELTIACALKTQASSATAPDGEITVDIQGGTATYTLTGDKGIVTQNTLASGIATISGLKADTYTITITDKNGCTKTCQTTVTPKPIVCNMTAAVTIVKAVSCNNATDGELKVEVTNDFAPYTYVWSPATATGATPTALAANTYNVTVTDANNCTATSSATLPNPTAITATLTATLIKCAGDKATITTTAAGGTAPLEYSLDGITYQASNTFSVVTGSYTVTVRDKNLCTVTTTNLIINEPAKITLACSKVKAATSSSNLDGEGSVTIAGGTAPYEITGTGITTQTNVPVGTATLPKLKAGTYTVTVTDANGCKETCTFEIDIFDPTCSLTLSLKETQKIKCFGDKTATIEATVTNAVGVATYKWSNDPLFTLATQTGLGAGTYTVTVKDAKGCEQVKTITIDEPAKINVLLTPQAIACNGGTTSLVVAATGGTAPFTYKLDAGTAQNASTFTGVKAGSHTVLVTDANGCTASETINLFEPAALQLACEKVSNVTTVGGADGKGRVKITGGTADYTVTLAGPSPQGPITVAIGGSFTNFDNLAAGSYTVTVKDKNGCTQTCGFVISPAVCTMKASIAITAPLTCLGNDGALSVSVTSGVAPYTYAWTPSTVLGASPTGLGVGTYTVTVNDAGGCSATATKTLTAPPAPTAAIANVPKLDCNKPTAQLVGTTNAGGNATFQWTDAQNTVLSTTKTVTVSAGGTYTFKVTSATGCTSTAVAQVQSLIKTVAVSAGPDLDLDLCLGTELNLNVTTNAALLNTSYQWTVLNGGVITGAPNALNTTANKEGTYVITVKENGTGCIGRDTVNVKLVPNNLTAEAGLDQTVCGNSVSLTAIEPPTGAFGQWKVKGSATGVTFLDSKEAKTDVQNLPPGKTTIAWFVTKGTCVASDEVVISAVQKVEANPDQYILAFDKTDLGNNVTNNDKFAGNITVSLLKDVEKGTLKLETDGLFNYKPEKDKYGDYSFEYKICSAVCPTYCDTALATIMYQSKPFEITDSIPNAISPNGDGVNDVFVLPFLDQLVMPELIIVNRWGSVVFKQRPYLNNWGGSNQGNDLLLPEGTYYYYLRTDDKRFIQGHITIIR